MASRTFLFIFTVWKRRNGVAFRDEFFSIQKLKSSFCFSFMFGDKLNLADGPLTLVSVICWVGCR